MRRDAGDGMELVLLHVASYVGTGLIGLAGISVILQHQVGTVRAKLLLGRYRRHRGYRPSSDIDGGIAYHLAANAGIGTASMKAPARTCQFRFLDLKLAVWNGSIWVAHCRWRRVTDLFPNSLLEPGDSLWRYSMRGERTAKRGLALMRDGAIIDHEEQIHLLYATSRE